MSPTGAGCTSVISTAAWLRGLVPNPLMRTPTPRQIEIDSIYELLKKLGLSVIDKRKTAIEKLEAVSSQACATPTVPSRVWDPSPTRRPAS